VKMRLERQALHPCDGSQPQADPADHIVTEVVGHLRRAPCKYLHSDCSFSQADSSSDMLNLWLISSSGTHPLPDAERGVFWSCNYYMVKARLRTSHLPELSRSVALFVGQILYSFSLDGQPQSMLFFWQGQDASTTDVLKWRFQLAGVLSRIPSVLLSDFHKLSSVTDTHKTLPTNPIRHGLTLRHIGLVCQVSISETLLQNEETAAFVELMEGMIVLSGRHPVTQYDAVCQAQGRYIQCSRRSRHRLHHSQHCFTLFEWLGSGNAWMGRPIFCPWSHWAQSP